MELLPKSPMKITCEEGFSFKVVQMAYKRDDSTSLGDLYIPIKIKSRHWTVLKIVNFRGRSIFI